MLVLIVLAAVAVSALTGSRDARESIEPQSGVYTKVPRGWDVVSSSTPDGTARIPQNNEMAFGPTLAPEEFSDMSVEETMDYEGTRLALWSSGNNCRSNQESNDFINGMDLPLITNGYNRMDTAGRTLDRGDVTVAGRDASWNLSYYAIVSPWNEPGDSSASQYPNYSGTASLTVCIEDLDLYIIYDASASLEDTPSDSGNPPTEDRNALLSESREEINNEIQASFEENLDVMTQLLEDIDTNGWDGSTDLGGLPTNLDAYDDILADPFDGELGGE